MLVISHSPGIGQRVRTVGSGVWRKLVRLIAGEIVCSKEAAGAVRSSFGKRLSS